MAPEPHGPTSDLLAAIDRFTDELVHGPRRPDPPILLPSWWRDTLTPDEQKSVEDMAGERGVMWNGS